MIVRVMFSMFAHRILQGISSAYAAMSITQPERKNLMSISAQPDDYLTSKPMANSKKLKTAIAYGQWVTTTTAENFNDRK